VTIFACTYINTSEMMYLHVLVQFLNNQKYNIIPYKLKNSKYRNLQYSDLFASVITRVKHLKVVCISSALEYSSYLFKFYANFKSHFVLFISLFPTITLKFNKYYFSLMKCCNNFQISNFYNLKRY